jgi:hypothetical protein
MPGGIIIYIIIIIILIITIPVITITITITITTTILVPTYLSLVVRSPSHSCIKVVLTDVRVPVLWNKRQQHHYH